ncbi:uncharacterized protein [Miscanthus floridulus]|uniref:uncharacterized protein n=1 Tax=Miscanthus floridulus TaxID=154761 RepID=UPI003458FB78
MAAMQATLAALIPPPPPPQQPAPPPPPQPSQPQAIFPYGMPQTSGTGVPLHLLRWPASLSPIPSWAMGSTTPPIYTMATTPTPLAAAVAASSGAHQPPPTSGIFYGGTDGILIYGGGGYSGGALSVEDSSVASPNGAHAPPKFYKLEFPSFDGAADLLNWLNHYEQFFHGQRTLALDRTWLASYHLRGAAQTWYYALEQDEGMPTWNASAICASSASAPRRKARGWPSSPGYPFSHRSRSIRTAIMPCSAMLTTSILARRRNCSWVAFPSTSRSTSRCATRSTFSRPCTTLGRTSVARQPSWLRRNSSAALGLRCALGEKQVGAVYAGKRPPSSVCWFSDTNFVMTSLYAPLAVGSGEMVTYNETNHHKHGNPRQWR